jgi:hypothetical protein
MPVGLTCGTVADVARAQHRRLTSRVQVGRYGRRVQRSRRHNHRLLRLLGVYRAVRVTASVRARRLAVADPSRLTVVGHPIVVTDLGRLGEASSALLAVSPGQPAIASDRLRAMNEIDEWAQVPRGDLDGVVALLPQCA